MNIFPFDLGHHDGRLMFTAYVMARNVDLAKQHGGSASFGCAPTFSWVDVDVAVLSPTEVRFSVDVEEIERLVIDHTFKREGALAGHVEERKRKVAHQTYHERLKAEQERIERAGVGAVFQELFGAPAGPGAGTPAGAAAPATAPA